jgi:arylsulfatase A-like enzyme
MVKWIVAVAAMVGAAVGGEAWGAEGKKRPNVVILLADQWRGQALGYAGDKNVITPNLDRMAAESVNFRNAVSGNPVCSPCRASILTGQRPVTHGIFLNDAHLRDEAVTLAEVMKGAGYATGMIGKWHLNGRGRLSYIPPENRQGFDYWKVMECTHAYNESYYYGDTPEKLKWEGYDALAQTKDACEYIKEKGKEGKPFLLCLWWGPPHNPYGTAPKEYKEKYEAGKIELRENVPGVYADEARKEHAGYYAHCTALDDCVARVREALKGAGVEDDTIIIFSSDHGDMLWSHGFNRKQKPWDESVRVPMLWTWPAGLGREGKDVDGAMNTEDIMPTILGLCGVDGPKGMEGLDYSKYMKGGENPNKGNAAVLGCVAPFGEWNRLVGGREYRGLRTERYTYVRDLKGPWLLYDNEKDPYQKENLVGKGLEVEGTLEARLKEKLAATGDEFLTGEEYLKRWGYASRVDAKGTLPTRP